MPCRNHPLLNGQRRAHMDATAAADTICSQLRLNQEVVEHGTLGLFGAARGDRGRSRDHRRDGRDDDVRRGSATRVLLARQRRTKAALTRGAAVTPRTSRATGIHKQGGVFCTAPRYAFNPGTPGPSVGCLVAHRQLSRENRTKIKMSEIQSRYPGQCAPHSPSCSFLRLSQ
jgi:hypothetical protein